MLRRDWDLLDKLLEEDNRLVNHNSMFTDPWGEWWSMLLHCVLRDEAVGARVLLKHGADPDLASWGDGIPVSPREMASEKPWLTVLLAENNGRPDYQREKEPVWPPPSTNAVQEANRLEEIARRTGLVFQSEIDQEKTDEISPPPD